MFIFIPFNIKSEVELFADDFKGLVRSFYKEITQTDQKGCRIGRIFQNQNLTWKILDPKTLKLNID